MDQNDFITMVQHFDMIQSKLSWRQTFTWTNDYEINHDQLAVIKGLQNNQHTFHLCQQYFSLNHH